MTDYKRLTAEHDEWLRQMSEEVARFRRQMTAWVLSAAAVFGMALGIAVGMLTR